MTLYIAIKDLISFFKSEKKIFIWLLICMVSGSFVLNYSYSFARYRAMIYEHNIGSDIPTYKIICDGNAPCIIVDSFLKSLSNDNYPQIDNYQLISDTNSQFRVVGSSFISEKLASLTGIWTEGYAFEIKNTGENICAVNSDLLNYGEHIKMTDEKIQFLGEVFTIKGVFEQSESGIIIFADKFIEMFECFGEMRITFEKKLDDRQTENLKKELIKLFPHGKLVIPPKFGETSADVVKFNEFQYTAIIFLFVVCLVSLIKYWQSINISTYTIYWINGATRKKIMLISLYESTLLCILTYPVGLGLNALMRFYVTKSAPLELSDIRLGFGIFWGTFAVFTLFNTIKICKKLNVIDVRRD